MSNMTENTVTFTLDKQLATLGALAEKISRRLGEIPGNTTKEAADQLSHLATNLNRFSQQIGQDVEEKKNLQELANIGSVINSSLNPDEVLRIVGRNTASVEPDGHASLRAAQSQ